MSRVIFLSISVAILGLSISCNNNPTSPTTNNYYTNIFSSNVYVGTGNTYITQNTTWSGYVELFGKVIVENGATLTLQPGTRLMFHKETLLDIFEGAVIANGTSGSRIEFFSYGTNYFTSLQVSTNSRFNYCLFNIFGVNLNGGGVYSNSVFSNIPGSCDGSGAYITYFYNCDFISMTSAYGYPLSYCYLSNCYRTNTETNTATTTIISERGTRNF